MVKFMNLAILNNTQTMSSTQLLEMMHFESKSSLHKAIKLMFKGKIDDSTLESSINPNGTVDEYHLPELESKMFVAKHDIKYLEVITQYWIENSHVKPLTITEIIVQQALLLDVQSKQISVLTNDIAEIKAKITATPTQYYTVAGYYSLIGLQIDTAGAAKIGKAAVKLSAEMNLPIFKAHSSKYGQVNTYHKDVLAEL